MIQLAFKKTATSFFGKLIKLYTFSKYCHAEIVFSNGEWFSSREVRNGAGFCYGPPPGDSVEMYDLVPVPMSPDDEARMRRWCKTEMPCSYDVRGVLFSFLPIPIGWQSAEKWFCSEICCAAFQTIGWFAGYTASAVSPRKLYDLTVKEVMKR